MKQSRGKGACRPLTGAAAAACAAALPRPGVVAGAVAARALAPGAGWRGCWGNGACAAARPVTGTPGVGWEVSPAERGSGGEATVCLGHLDLPIRF